MIKCREITGSRYPQDLLELQCYFNPRWSDNQIEQQLLSPVGLNFAAVDNNRCVGFVFAQCIQDQAEIFQIAIAENRRGEGVAKDLLQNLLAALSLRQVEQVFLEVRESNIAAIRLYFSLGFSQAGVRKNYYSVVKNNQVLSKENALVLVHDTLACFKHSETMCEIG